MRKIQINHLPGYPLLRKPATIELLKETTSITRIHQNPSFQHGCVYLAITRLFLETEMTNPNRILSHPSLRFVNAKDGIWE